MEGRVLKGIVKKINLWRERWFKISTSKYGMSLVTIDVKIAKLTVPLSRFDY